MGRRLSVCKAGEELAPARQSSWDGIAKVTRRYQEERTLHPKDEAVTTDITYDMIEISYDKGVEGNRESAIRIAKKELDHNPEAFVYINNERYTAATVNFIIGLWVQKSEVSVDEGDQGAQGVQGETEEVEELEVIS